MFQYLVIVESPTKAKTITKFLSSDYRIESSFGHVRDLPKTKMGVDIEHDFTPTYVVPKTAKERVKELQKFAAQAKKVYFATDEDREGEAISWHLCQLLDIPEEKAQRVTFHEITKSAILEAFQKPRSIKKDLVDAQQARRVLDRLVGYELSPFLWKKVIKGLSAGRVQSVAVRLIVEREREIQKFKAQEYWTIEGVFKKKGHDLNFKGKLNEVDGKKLEKLSIGSETAAKDIVQDLQKGAYSVTNVQQKSVKRSPLPPYITSTLQQDATRRLGYSAKQVMRLAQQLYEGIPLGDKGDTGLITYMRTDSLNLSEKFLSEARQHISQQFGEKYALSAARRFKKKSKLAQEAHEAIRPTEVVLTPDSVKTHLSAQQFKLYDLIWRRAVSSQMKEAELLATSIDITNTSGKKYVFRSTGLQLRFPGFLKLYPDSVTEEMLPALQSGDGIDPVEIKPLQHFTEPPARYTEASLVKTLEENGIGRPSTYAPTMSTIQDRGYVEKEDRKFKPTEIGMVVNDLLVNHFQNIVDVGFTATMEDDLDKIASGEKTWVPVIRDFYQPFKENLGVKEKELQKKTITEEKTDEVCEKCGKPMVIKLGRFGRFLACSGYPDCKNTKQLNGNGKVEPEETSNEKCDTCGSPMKIKRGRFGKFLGCSRYPECKGVKRIENKVGVACPECGQGEMIEKRSKRGRSFYSCNRYPKCRFALWNKPTGEKCPQCQSLLVFGKDNTARCSKKDCDFVKNLPAE